MVVLVVVVVMVVTIVLVSLRLLLVTVRVADTLSPFSSNTSHLYSPGGILPSLTCKLTISLSLFL